MCCCYFFLRSVLFFARRHTHTDILANKNLCDLNRNDDFNIQICIHTVHIRMYKGKILYYYFETGQIFFFYIMWILILENLLMMRVMLLSCAHKYPSVCVHMCATKRISISLPLAFFLPFFAASQRDTLYKVVQICEKKLLLIPFWLNLRFIFLFVFLFFLFLLIIHGWTASSHLSKNERLSNIYFFLSPFESRNWNISNDLWNRAAETDDRLF